MTPIEVTRLVAVLAAHYPNAKLSRVNIMAYERSLSDLDYQAAQSAVDQVVKTSKFFPAVSEIRDAAAEIACGPVRSGAEAYTDVMLAIRRHGKCYGNEPPPKFQDPLISRCLLIWGGSWNDVCNSDDDDPGGRARFIQLYDSLARGERQGVVTGRVLPEATAAVSRLLAGIGGGGAKR